jgi:hypothetical protein
VREVAVTRADGSGGAAGADDQDRLHTVGHYSCGE